MANDSCRLCGASEARLVAVVDGCQYVRCAGCGVERMAKYPSPAELREFYDSGYGSQRATNPSIHIHFSPEYRQAYFAEKDLTFSDLKLAPSAFAGRRVLDVGCANGQFLEYLKKHDVEAEGIDISTELVNIARESGLNCRVKDIMDVEGEYSLITFWDVIEHMVNTKEAVRKACALLARDGELIIQTPCTGTISELFADSWLYYMPMEHIHLFSQESLFKLLSDTGFSVVSWVRFGSCNPKGSIPDVNKKAMDTIAKRMGIGDTIVVRARRTDN
jgi:2-polyprenyl-3-methyl-5-hydroxy-6-metoxy-1,4-benzoquinol methylase